MSGNNNNNSSNNMKDSTNGHTVGHHGTGIGSPVDSTFVSITDTNTTSIQDNGYIEGCSLKEPAISKQVKRIHQKVISQILLALVRNVLCWACLVTLFIMFTHGRIFSDWEAAAPAGIIVIIVFSCGLLGVGFHITRGYYDLTYKNPTVVAKLLRDGLASEDFIRIIQTRQLSPPEIFLEVSLRSGAMSHADPNHWTRKGRKTVRELSYRGWADQSDAVNTITYLEDGASWIVVAKDMRCVDDTSKKSVDGEIAEFRRDTGFDANSYFMNFEVNLQYKEADSSPDAEAFLMFDNGRALIYHMNLYKASWFLALDSIYRMIFHLNTKRLNDYYIIKFIER